MKKKTTIKKKLSSSKSTKTVKKKYAVLKFDLENEHEWDSFKNAMKADHLVMKIDELYQEVFRPHMKYYVPIIDVEGNEIEMDERVTEILRAIFFKCNEHFNPREE